LKYGLIVILLNSCDRKDPSDKTAVRAFNYSIDTSKIPTETISFQNTDVSFINRLYYAEDKVFSSIVFKQIKGYNVKTYSSVFNGMLHGTYKSFYENGEPYKARHQCR